MNGSGWFLTVVVMGGMLTSIVPGLERWGGYLILSALFAFFDREKRERESTR